MDLIIRLIIFFYAESTQNEDFGVQFLSNLRGEKGLERTNCVEKWRHADLVWSQNSSRYKII